MRADIRRSTIRKITNFHGPKPSATSWQPRSGVTPPSRGPSRSRAGELGNEVDFLEPDPDRRVKKISEYVTPKVTGELFFYLNDAVVILPRRYQWLYNDNTGCMSFFIKPS